jgi:hypothetical protein
MAVNVNTTKFIVFHTKAKSIPGNTINIFFKTTNLAAMTNLISELERCHTKHADNNCRTYKLLGIYFNENLTFL